MIQWVSEKGSILVVVMWTITMITYLTAEYTAHNRNKAYVATYAMESFKRKQAIDSMLQFYKSQALQFVVPSKLKQETWIRFDPGGIEVWGRQTDESKRVNLNSGQDQEIRNKLILLLGNDRVDEADQLSDAILDWRDEDNLIRLSGAEDAFYKGERLPYLPANEQFKILTEVLLVRGMNSDIFWGDPRSTMFSGDPLAENSSQLNPRDEETDESLLNQETGLDTGAKRFVNAFTLYNKDIQRIELIIPGAGDSYDFVIAFLQKEGHTGKIIGMHHTLINGKPKDETADE
ncbi:MAG: general secretion pathway protein GspK [Desulfobacterales bacterium]|nr:general secretion pathway protein GspK [Desulfobacterales bacterium]